MSGLKRFGTPDIFHDSGLWLPHNQFIANAALRTSAARVVSTRGMLEPWALRHKPFKKRMAWIAYQRRNLLAAHRLHVTSEPEREAVGHLYPAERIDLIPNGIDVPELGELASVTRNETPRRAVYLGRLHPVKGLDLLIEAWARVRPQGWVLDIVGPSEAGQETVLKGMIAKRDLAGVRLAGAVARAGKTRLLADADLFILPSRSESFGVAVGEALAHGTPVLTTTAVPWPDLEDVGCGWRVQPNVESLAARLTSVLQMPPEELNRKGAVGRELIQARFSWSGVVRRFMSTYHRAIEATS